MLNYILRVKDMYNTIIVYNSLHNAHIILNTLIKHRRINFLYVNAYLSNLSCMHFIYTATSESVNTLRWFYVKGDTTTNFLSNR